ncbi:cell wall-active antibiotics response protein [Paenibacillus sp. F411]|uniref:cell wall-active antibiotics response protein LiaF n=1 Tax=Paenibacillus sp. F411 TaxID=2820239 RepID=UPI001AAF60FD|nr:cell wall-active antibiotics response protein LiaF [Paenibacillus sp. F411]MBO2943916.1 cell wall-active antibiotics response protein [Paenibacillus sp. F411]
MEKNSGIAFVLIGLGIFLLFGKWIGFFTVVALLLVAAGIQQIRVGWPKRGYVLLGVGSVMLLLDHLMLVIGIGLISLGFFYGKVKKAHRNDRFHQQQTFMSNFDWDRAPWVMQSLSVWHVLGEADVDLSLALPEEKETVLMFHGLLGDIDIVIPEYYGVEIEAFILFGSIDTSLKRETGIMNRLNWKSPNYETSEYKVKFIVFYLGGDLSIRMV